MIRPWKIRAARPVLLAALALCACKEPPPQRSPQARDFEVRGEVVQVPVADKPGSQFIVHHEAVPGFIDEEGRVVGMQAMTMYLPTAKDLKLTGLGPGDKIRFNLLVDWPNHRVEVTRIDPLPPDTRLDFGTASPGE
jgi:hypothetical protein